MFYTLLISYEKTAISTRFLCAFAIWVSSHRLFDSRWRLSHEVCLVLLGFGFELLRHTQKLSIRSFPARGGTNLIRTSCCIGHAHALQAATRLTSRPHGSLWGHPTRYSKSITSAWLHYIGPLDLPLVGPSRQRSGIGPFMSLSCCP